MPTPIPSRPLTLSRRAATDALHPADVVTLAVMFLLYSNLPAVAIRFHGAPGLFAPAVGLLLLIPLADYLLIRRRRVIVTSNTLWVLLFMLVQFASLLASKDPVRAVGNFMTTVVEGFGVYLILTNVVRSAQMLRRVIWTLLLVAGLLGTVSVVQFQLKNFDYNYAGLGQIGTTPALGASPYEHPGEGERRLSGSIGEANRYAQVMLMLVPLGFFRFLGERRRPRRALALGAMLLAMMATMLTFSRGAAVSFVLMLGIVVALRSITLRQAGLMMGGGLLLVANSSLYVDRLLSLGTLGNSLAQQNEAFEAGEIDTSIQGRDTEVRAALLMFYEHPLLGVGPGLYPKYYVPYAERAGGRVRDTERESHSLYVGMAAELGTLGLAAFLALSAAVVRSLVRGARRCRTHHPDLANMARGFMLVLVAYLSTALFLHFSYERYFWIMLALASVAARLTATAPCPATTAWGKAALR